MNILFVCTGNTCRSVMAEYYTRSKFDELGITGVTVNSAGIATVDGLPASQGALAVLEELEIDASGHLTRLLSQEMAEAADKIYALAKNHQTVMETAFPSLKGKVFLLADRSVPDPVGLTLEEYRDSLDMIIGAIDQHILLKL